MVRSYRTSSWFMLVCIGIFLTSLLTVPGCYKDDDDDDDGVISDTIAVYNGDGVWDVSATAIQLCLENAGREVKLLDASAFQQGLRNYGVVIIGEGDPEEISDALGYTGRQNILNLVSRGGGYIGLGAGAYLAADSMVINRLTSYAYGLGLYHGLAEGPVDLIAPNPSYAMTIVNLDQYYLNPTSIGAVQVLYHGGPQFNIISPTAVSIATLAVTQTPAAAIFEYGNGRVVVCSVQPEIEEDSGRDGSNFGSDLSEPDSEWFWLQTMVEWVKKERSE